MRVVLIDVKNGKKPIPLRKIPFFAKMRPSYEGCLDCGAHLRTSLRMTSPTIIFSLRRILGRLLTNSNTQHAATWLIHRETTRMIFLSSCLYLPCYSHLSMQVILLLTESHLCSKKDRQLKRKQRSRHPSSEEVAPLIVDIKPNETTPDRLTYRHCNSSVDGIDVMSTQSNI
jgi:hypothetical protein